MQITVDTGGERVDAALSRLMPDLSRNAAQRLLEANAVLRNGKPVKKSDRTVPGDVLTVTMPQVRETELLPEDIPLQVAYEDDDVIVVNKSKGLVVHPAAGHPDGTLVNALLYHCGDSLSGIGGEKRPGIVHRIDKDTSGLLIAAKNDFAHNALAAQLKDHSLHRIYEAVVRGAFKEDSGTISGAIGRHQTNRKKMAVLDRGGREAVTHFRVLQRYAGYTYLELRLETGRTHQIRVHLSWVGHPVVGDLVYGYRKPELGQDSQCLHARTLVFRHPGTGEEVAVTSDLPDYFQDVLNKLEHKKL